MLADVRLREACVTPCPANPSGGGEWNEGGGGGEQKEKIKSIIGMIGKC